MAATHFSGPVLHSGQPTSLQYNGESLVDFEPGYVRFYEDWITKLDASTAATTTATWQTIADTSATVAQGADARAGTIVLTSTTETDDDGASIQEIQETWTLTSAKPLWYAARLQIADVSQVDAWAGLSQNFTTNPEAVFSAQNRVGFRVNDGSATVLCETVAANTATTTSSGVALVNATDADLAFKFDGANVYFYIGGNQVAVHNTNIPTTELAISFAEISGSTTGTQSMTVDYAFVQMVR